MLFVVYSVYCVYCVYPVYSVCIPRSAAPQHMADGARKVVGSAYLSLSKHFASAAANFCAALRVAVLERRLDPLRVAVCSAGCAPQEEARVGRSAARVPAAAAKVQFAQHV